MYPCREQDTIITVVPTSRHGLPYDVARVEATFLLNQPLPPNDSLLVPTMELIPQDVLQILKLSNVHLAPIPESVVNQMLSDFAQESADPNRAEETKEDAILGLVRKYFGKIAPPKLGQDNYYRVSYEYSLYPNPDGTFDIFAALPFKGFDMPAGSKVRFVTILPDGAHYDPNATTGTALNNQNIDEQVANVANGMTVISFFWQNDPKFLVKYKY